MSDTAQAGGRQLPLDVVAEVVQRLGQEAVALQELVFRLRVVELVSKSGEHEHLVNAVADVDETREQLRAAALLREAATHVIADDQRVTPERVTSGWLIEQLQQGGDTAAPAPIRDVYDVRVHQAASGAQPAEVDIRQQLLVSLVVLRDRANLFAVEAADLEQRVERTARERLAELEAVRDRLEALGAGDPPATYDGSAPPAARVHGSA